MQSPVAVACRVLVMLAFLVAVPLAAILGSSLPQTIQALLQGHTNSASARQSGPQAPRIRGPSSVDSLPDWPSQSAEGDGASRRSASLLSLASTATIGKAPKSESLLAALMPFGPTQRPVAAKPLAPAAPLAAASAAAADPQQPSAPSEPGESRLQAVQQRLQQLGATYYVLESWGNRGQLYRFQCRMAIGGNPNWNRCFEATDADPLTAITQVMEEVEAWRSGGG